MRRVLLAFGLAATFLVAVGRLDVGNAALALAVGAAVSFTCGRTASERVSVRRVTATPWFVLGVLLELLRGSWKMLRVLIGFDDWRDVGTVEMPITPRSERGLVVLSIVTTATPGTVVVDVDEHRDLLLVNAIDASDPKAIRDGIERFYDRHQRPMAP